MSRPPLVSIVFVSHNRAKTLIPVFESVLSNTDYPRDRLELILSDDGSDADTLASIEHLPFDRRILSDRVEGLGANQNKGVRAATGDYILSLQDDCLISGPRDWLSRSIRLLQDNPDVQFLSLLPRPELPVDEHRPTRDGDVVIVGPQKQVQGQHRHYPYSDQPHIKRQSFHRIAGDYQEGVPMHVMEIEFCRRTMAMSELRFAYVAGLHPFRHIGADDSFNPVQLRHQRIIRREALPIVGPLLGWARRTAKRFRRPAQL